MQQGHEAAAELLDAFPHLDSDVVAAFLASTDGAVTADVRAALGLPAGLRWADLPALESSAPAGTPVWLDSSEPVTVVGPRGEPHGVRRVVVCAQRFGTLWLRGVARAPSVVYTTPTYELAVRVDALFDALFWGWSGAFTPALEAALVGLMDCEAQLNASITMLSSMSAAMVGGTSDVYAELQRSTQADLLQALTEHSNAAMGKLHSTLHQVVQVSCVWSRARWRWTAHRLFAQRACFPWTQPLRSS